MTATQAATFERREGVAFGKPYHAYYLNGVKLPGVTTILSNGLPAPALTNWAANVTAEYAVDHWAALDAMAVSERIATLKGARWEVSGKAALRGTQIHTLAYKLAHGLEVDVPDEHVGPVEAVARFLDRFAVDPVLLETPVCHLEHRWGGTTDLTAYIGGELWLLDYKTGKGLYDKDALQLAAYAHATHYLDPAGTLREWAAPDRAGLIHVTQDSAELHPVQVGETEYRMFRHVKQVGDWLDYIKMASPIGTAMEVSE